MASESEPLLPAIATTQDTLVQQTARRLIDVAATRPEIPARLYNVEIQDFVGAQDLPPWTFATAPQVAAVASAQMPELPPWTGSIMRKLEMVAD